MTSLRRRSAGIDRAGRTGTSRVWTREFSASVVALALVIALLGLYGSTYTLTLGSKVAIYAIVILGLTLLVGYGGQISFGHNAFFGVGGYISALATTSWGLDPLVSMVVAAVIAGVATNRFWEIASRRRLKSFPCWRIVAGRWHRPSAVAKRRCCPSRALMSGPSLLLLDEPSLGLAPIMRRRLFERIAVLKQTGLAMIIVEQRAAELLDVSDGLLQMRRGEAVGTTTAADVDAESLARLYFGVASDRFTNHTN